MKKCGVTDGQRNWLPPAIDVKSCPTMTQEAAMQMPGCALAGWWTWAAAGRSPREFAAVFRRGDDRGHRAGRPRERGAQRQRKPGPGVLARATTAEALFLAALAPGD